MSYAGDLERVLPSWGDRYVPFVQGDIERQHLHCYAFAQQLIPRRYVLDIACDEGCESHLVAGTMKAVIGVGRSMKAIRHARSKCVIPCQKLLQGDGAACL